MITFACATDEVAKTLSRVFDEPKGLGRTWRELNITLRGDGASRL